MAIKKMCPRCGKIIDHTDKYCDECSKNVIKNKKDSDRQYNKFIRQVRDKQYTDFYVSKEWKIVSNIVKDKYKGLCIMCLLQDDKLNSYDLIHHVLELKTDGGWEHRFDVDEGLVPLCHAHHNELHGNYNNEKIKMLRELIKEYKKIYGSM